MLSVRVSRVVPPSAFWSPPPSTPVLWYKADSETQSGRGHHHRRGRRRPWVGDNTAHDHGGGINVISGTVTLNTSAVERDTAEGGPGSGGGIYVAGGSVDLRRSVVRDNTPDNCAPTGAVLGCVG